MFFLITITVLFLLGFSLGWLCFRFYTRGSQIEQAVLLKHEKEKTDQLQDDLEKLRNLYIDSEKRNAELTAEKNNHKNWKEQFSNHFKNLSQEIIDNKSKQIQTQSEKNLLILLNPLKETIHSFKTQVEEIYGKESRERFSLKDKIHELCEVHGRLKEETRHLTKTLKGDVKAQGQWGEMILNTVLQASGLLENEHYITQAKGLSNINDQGKRQRPDVIIKLPDNKHIVIDAKVSLTHYERFINSDSKDEKNIHLSQFIGSIKSHVRQLSEKQYHLVESLNTLDFVLLFFPIEGAFSLALQSQPDIFNYCWKHSIVIVSPTTLLATLKTVASMWKREKQNRNAVEVAKLSGLLYDKFVSFTSDIEQIGSNLKKAEDSYYSAYQKLSSGQGNIVSKLERIKKLGARTNKQISSRWLPEGKNSDISL